MHIEAKAHCLQIQVSGRMIIWLKNHPYLGTISFLLQ